MARYLSSEWLDEMAEAAGGAVVPQSSRLLVQHVVTGGPDGEVVYTVSLGDGSLRVEPGRAEAPDVTFCSDYETAAGIARAELGASNALIGGRLTVSGDATALIGPDGVAADLDDVFAPVLARTSF